MGEQPPLTILAGDCLAAMRAMPDHSVDSIVTDPPYELGFMGKAWDNSGIANSVPMWTEALRVLKPGGYLLSFGGTRTYHRMTCAIEDAGFVIRDCLVWMYGSGFPKSLDVSKAFDKRRADDPRPVCRFLRAAIESNDMSTADVAEPFGFNRRMVEHWAARDTDSQPTVPTWEQWLQLKNLLSFGDEMDAEVWRLNGRKGTPGEAWAEREIVGERDVPIGHAFAGPTYGGDSSSKTVDVTTSSTDLAKQWNGFGTALKPAHEPIVLARKPLIGTVVANVERYGTGALNIDGSRIGTSGGGTTCPAWPSPCPGHPTSNRSLGGGANRHAAIDETVRGRWPANVLLDEDAAAMLGAPSRFFYVAKASKSDRGKGNTRPKGGPSTDDAARATLLASLPINSGDAVRFRYQAKAARKERGGSTHPTMKPIALMRYLVKLITPPGGVVLDPFAGSGTTGKAARAEGFACILIEREPEYLDIIHKWADQ